MNYQVEVASDLIVVGTNTEAADMSNPRGNIHGERYYVVISNGFGRRWASKVTWVGGPKACEPDEFSTAHVLIDGKDDAEDQAKDYAKTIEDMLAQGKRLNKDNWVEIDPIYGSRAYEAFDIEAQRAHQERIDEIGR